MLPGMSWRPPVSFIFHAAVRYPGPMRSPWYMTFVGSYAAKGENYRSRAIEIRRLADAVKDTDARLALLNVAYDYELMADQMQRMDLELK